MDVTPQSKADELWRIHNFYWKDEKLIAKQRIVIQIQEIIRVLRSLGINQDDFWQEVKLLIYNK